MLYSVKTLKIWFPVGARG